MKSHFFYPVSLKTKDFASGLIYEVFREYYNLFGLPKSKTIRLISEQFTMHGSEIHKTLILSNQNTTPCALLSCLPVSELKPAQIKSAFHLVSHVEKKKKALALNKIKQFSTKFPPLPQNYFYLSRIIVLSKFRGENMGKSLLDKFQSLGKNYAGLCLHVNKKRVSALRFYHENGYKTIGPENKPYLALAKKLNTNF